MMRYYSINLDVVFGTLNRCISLETGSKLHDEIMGLRADFNNEKNSAQYRVNDAVYNSVKNLNLMYID